MPTCPKCLVNTSALRSNCSNCGALLPGMPAPTDPGRAACAVPPSIPRAVAPGAISAAQPIAVVADPCAVARAEQLNALLERLKAMAIDWEFGDTSLEPEQPATSQDEIEARNADLAARAVLRTAGCMLASTVERMRIERGRYPSPAEHAARIARYQQAVAEARALAHANEPVITLAERAKPLARRVTEARERIRTVNGAIAYLGKRSRADARTLDGWRSELQKADRELTRAVDDLGIVIGVGHAGDPYFVFQVVASEAEKALKYVQEAKARSGGQYVARVSEYDWRVAVAEVAASWSDRAVAESRAPVPSARSDRASVKGRIDGWRDAASRLREAVEEIAPE